MGKNGYLGEFEHIVLLALMRLGGEAAGRAIYEETDRLASWRGVASGACPVWVSS